jgi:hypothetical protein
MYFLYSVLPFSILKLFRIGIFPTRETSLLLRVLLSMQCSGVFLSSVALCCFVGYRNYINKHIYNHIRIIYIFLRENCSAIIDADTPEDGNIKPKHVVWKSQNKETRLLHLKTVIYIVCCK